MNKTIVITGTATGIGQSTVERFAAEGWNVVATVRKDTDLHVHDAFDKVRTLLLDVDDEAADTAFANTGLEQFGRIDALVNNAGYFHMGPIEAGSMTQIHQQFQTNVFGLIALTKAFLPLFREQGSGVVVNLSSISADQGYPYTAAYAASKAAVAAFTEGLNIELEPTGVSAKAIFPGTHNTRIFTKIDESSNIPDVYREPMATFFGASASASGSAPSGVADVIFEAVTDGKKGQARYYAGPDAVSIPRARHLLGLPGYWDEFRAASLGTPSTLWTALMPTGTEPVDWSATA